MDLYDYQATLKHVNSLAFNRTASSAGELDAVNYIQKELEKDTIETNIEYFTWTGPLRLLMRTIYAIVICYLIVSGLFLVIVFYYGIKRLLGNKRLISLVKKEESKNVITKISAKKIINKQPLIIFSAHYDSFTSSLPYRIQKLLYLVSKVLGAIYVIYISIFTTIFIVDTISNLAINYYFVLVVGISTLVEISFIIPIYYKLFNETFKESTGSIDNATGVAILIELAKILSKNPLEKTDVLFLWCGAEEWGLKGSKKFCKRHFNELSQRYDLNKSFNINIDMVGTYIGLLDKNNLFRKKKMNYNLIKVLDLSAKRLNIPLKIYKKIIEPKSDHKSFQLLAKKNNKKFQVCCFHSIKDLRYIHSNQDSPDKCSSDILNGCLDICYDAIKNIDLRNK